jgi:hypothetical protein
MGTLPTCWPRARWSVCGAETGPSAARAAAIRSAVATAVPLGESAFPAWCADREVRHDQHRGGGLVPAGAEGGDALGGPAAGADEHRQAGGGRGVDDAPRDLGQRHVDDGVGRVVEAEGVGRADALHDRDVVEPGGDLVHEAAHAAVGTDDGEADHGRPP